jgi:hypothetical protein
MSIHRSCVAGVAFPLLLGGMVAACGGGRAESKTPATSAAAQATSAAPAPRTSAAPLPPNAQAPNAQARQSPHAATAGDSNEAEDQDAELVVGREVVARCPTLRLVRQHVGEFDPDTIWLAVLESIADCMSQGGAMAGKTIGVSGDEEHRHVVREVLGSRGVAPTRVIAKVAQGAAECQGGSNCSKRVEITIVAP